MTVSTVTNRCDNVNNDAVLYVTMSMVTCAMFTFIQRADFQEKLGEIETFRNVLCRQLDTLQTYFDMQGDVSSQNQGQYSLGHFMHH